MKPTVNSSRKSWVNESQQHHSYFIITDTHLCTQSICFSMLNSLCVHSRILLVLLMNKHVELI